MSRISDRSGNALTVTYDTDQASRRHRPLQIDYTVSNAGAARYRIAFQYPATDRSDPVSEILAQVKEDPEIGILVLGAGTEKNGPGPLVTAMSRNSGNLPIPITIVPGDMSKERLESIT